MKPDRLDRTVWTVLGVIALALVGVIAGNTLIGVRILHTFPTGGAVMDDTRRIGLTFAEPMQSDSVETRFVIEPSTAGSFQWEGTTMWFTPTKPWRPDVTYTAQVQAGAISRNGHTMRLTMGWTFVARTPWIVYLAPASHPPSGLWRVSSTGGVAEPLTPPEIIVQDFVVSPDGRQIAYSRQNAAGGFDLWRMDGNGQNAQPLVECAENLCVEPDWSPDGGTIAFTRHGPGLTPGAHGPPRVWLVDPDSHQTQPLYDDPQITAAAPRWSPDGQRLATIGWPESHIRILEIANRQDTLLPSLFSEMGSWSPDGTQFLYRDIEIMQENARAVLQRADLIKQSRDTVRVIDPESYFGLPIWSPSGEDLVVAQRLAGHAAPDQQLTLLSLDFQERQAITSAPGYAFSDYHWDSWGQAIVYLQYQPGAQDFHIDVAVWSRKTNSLRVVATDAKAPAWQP